MYAVKVPNKAFQKRYWSLPDRFILNETTFKTYFPDYAYKSEEDRETFPKKQIQVLKFNTSADSLVFKSLIFEHSIVRCSLLVS